MTDRWFKYVPHADVQQHLLDGWRFVENSACHHDAYSCLMEESPLKAAKRYVADCLRRASEATTELHNARMALLEAEDEEARSLD